MVVEVVVVDVVVVVAVVVVAMVVVVVVAVVVVAMVVVVVVVVVIELIASVGTANSCVGHTPSTTRTIEKILEHVSLRYYFVKFVSVSSTIKKKS